MTRDNERRAWELLDYYDFDDDLFKEALEGDILAALDEAEARATEAMRLAAAKIADDAGMRHGIGDAIRALKRPTPTTEEG